MTRLEQAPVRPASWAAILRGLILPVAAAAGIFVILCPLPPVLMDLLLAGNITFAAIILLTTIYVSRPLEFSVFPSLLLGATLIRLVLNVATTRLILTAGADGRTVETARFAAGHVIWAFSDFVTSGSLAVGVILFAIIVTIQFIVITKGASRISEVAARFVLDAMPGKQMAIDADLANGLLTQEEARRQRREVAQEADFYGAMDGASKFLRGDAVAAVIITGVNLLGGLYIGLVQYGWDWSRTVDLFTRLTIGDGLAAQVPALIVSVSAALLVTRNAGRSDLGEQVLAQLTSRPIVLAITAAFLLALTLTELPRLPLLMLGTGCAGLAWVLLRRPGEPDEPDAPRQAAEASDDELEQLLTVEPMALELGYTLVRFVDREQGGDLLDRVTVLRRELAGELGLWMPPVRVHDNLRISPRSYRIRIRGAMVAEHQVFPGQLLAVPAAGGAAVDLGGREAVEPASGARAVWIAPQQRERAERAGCRVLSSPDVVIAHLARVAREHAAELLSRQQVVKMLDGLRGRAESLVQEVTERLTVGQVQRILEALLRERVPIRDLESILDAVSEQMDRTGKVESPEQLSEHVRARLGRTLSQQYCAEDGRLWCVRVGGQWERELAAGPDDDDGDGAERTTAWAGLSGELSAGLDRLRREGKRPVVLCSPGVRPALHRMIQPSQPDVAVLGYNEVDSTEIYTVAEVGAER